MVLRLVVAVVLVARIASAEDKPWAAGISAENQKQALVVYEQANALFEQSQYKDALELYEQALALWKHPAVYYNAAVCLINLDRPVDAFEYLELALAYGEAPLGPDLHKQGVTYRKMLAAQVAELEVVLKTDGAAVSLDGKPLFDAPGKAVRRVRVGEPHQVVARKPGYETETRTVRLSPGEKTTLVLEMKLLEGSKWKPWAVVAVGGLLAAGGGVLLAKSFDDYDAFDRAVTEHCPCATEEEFLMRAGSAGELDKRARTEAIIAYSAFAVGGAALVIGTYLVARNRGKPTVTPVAGADRGGVALTMSW